MNNEKITSIIYETIDYDKFKFIKSNQKINRNHVEILKEIMKNKVLPMPIIVNQELEIINGKHRFQALKELGLSIKFCTI
jgi:hypothetical protein